MAYSMPQEGFAVAGLKLATEHEVSTRIYTATLLSYLLSLISFSCKCARNANIRANEHLPFPSPANADHTCSFCRASSSICSIAVTTFYVETQ